MKLNSYFLYFLTYALMRKPPMWQITAYKYQFQITDYFSMIANNAFGARAVCNKIQLKLLVIMKREIEIFLDSRKQHKAITLGQGCNFTVNGIHRRLRGWQNSITKYSGQIYDYLALNNKSLYTSLIYHQIIYFF